MPVKANSGALHQKQNQKQNVIVNVHVGKAVGERKKKKSKNTRAKPSHHGIQQQQTQIRHLPSSVQTVVQIPGGMAGQNPFGGMANPGVSVNHINSQAQRSNFLQSLSSEYADLSRMHSSNPSMVEQINNRARQLQDILLAGPAPIRNFVPPNVYQPPQPIGPQAALRAASGQNFEINDRDALAPSVSDDLPMGDANNNNIISSSESIASEAHAPPPYRRSAPVVDPEMLPRNNAQPDYVDLPDHAHPDYVDLPDHAHPDHIHLPQSEANFALHAPPREQPHAHAAGPAGNLLALRNPIEQFQLQNIDKIIPAPMPQPMPQFILNQQFNHFHPNHFQNQGIPQPNLVFDRPLGQNPIHMQQFQALPQALPALQALPAPQALPALPAPQAQQEIIPYGAQAQEQDNMDIDLDAQQQREDLIKEIHEVGDRWQDGHFTINERQDARGRLLAIGRRVADFFDSDSLRRYATVGRHIRYNTLIEKMMNKLRNR